MNNSDIEKLPQIIGITGVCEVFERERFLIRISNIDIGIEKIYFEIDIISQTHEKFIPFADEFDNSIWEYVNSPPCNGIKEFCIIIDLNVFIESNTFPESFSIFGNSQEEFIFILTKQNGFAMRVFYNNEVIEKFNRILKLN